MSNRELYLIIFDLEKMFEKTEVIIKKIKLFLPLNEIKLEDEEVYSKIDSFIFRISKIQDLMGQQLFKRVLDEVLEYSNQMTMIDMLNKLEKINILDKNEWTSFRKIRNDLTHDYTNDVEAIEETLKESFKMFDKMKNIFENCKTKVIK
jgi:DNA-binding ferritin-like protein (Dps family)